MSTKTGGSYRIFFAFGVALLALAGGGCRSSQNAARPATMSRPSSPATTAPTGTVSRSCGTDSCLYVDTVRKFAMRYPLNWQAKEGVLGTAATFISPLADNKDTFRETVSVVTEQVAPTLALSAYYDNSIENIKNYFTKFKVLKKENVTIGTYPGIKATYQMSQGTMGLQTTQLFTIKDGQAYVITLTATQERPTAFANEMTAIGSSFQFIY